MKPIVIEYRFELEEGRADVFTLHLDPQRLETIDTAPSELPQWTDLDFCQCGNCPLDPTVEPSCPAAVNMVRVVEQFAELLSHDMVSVAVKTQERLVYSHTTVQRGVCSLMGLLMAASACPMTTFFKPMARFHLPFASTEETIWRATSAYLLAQYFRQQDGATPDINLKGLTRIYNEIQTVNLAFASRLRAACRHDSMVNAIILLDMFAKSMPSAIEESLEEIRHLFVPFLPYSK